MKVGVAWGRWVKVTTCVMSSVTVAMAVWVARLVWRDVTVAVTVMVLVVVVVVEGVAAVVVDLVKPTQEQALE